MALNLIDRGQKHTTYQDSQSGLHQAVFTVHDQHVREAGFWVPTDEAFAVDGLDGFDFGMRRLRHWTRIVQLTGVCRYHPVKDGLLKYVTIGRPQRFGAIWADMLLGVRSQNGNLQSFDTADHGYDLLSTWRQVEPFYRLKNASAPTRIRLPLTFNNLGFDWASREVRDGSTIVSRLGVTTAWDANGAPVAVVESWDGTYLELNIDTTGAVFPITVDPTFTDGPSGDVTTAKDCGMLNGASSGKNYGTGTTFFYNADARKNLIQFDLSSIDAANNCDSATFSQFFTSSAANGTITVYSVASGNTGWPEGTKNNATALSGDCCWDFFDAVGTAWAGSAGLSTSGTDYEASAMGTVDHASTDVAGTEYACSLNTTRVKGWFGAVNTNYGMLMLSNTAGFPSTATSDHATAAYRPKLVVVYSSSAAAPQRRTRTLLGVGR